MRPEYLLAYMIEPLNEKPFAKWPIHITVIPWFTTDLSESKLVDWCSSVLQNTNELEVEVGEQTQFQGHVPVHLLVESDGRKALLSLHRRLIKSLSADGLKIINHDFVGEHYTPHVTVRGDRFIKEGRVFKIDHLTLAKVVSRSPIVRQKVADISF